MTRCSQPQVGMSRTIETKHQTRSEPEPEDLVRSRCGAPRWLWVALSRPFAVAIDHCCEAGIEVGELWFGLVLVGRASRGFRPFVFRQVDACGAVKSYSCCEGGLGDDGTGDDLGEPFAGVGGAGGVDDERVV